MSQLREYKRWNYHAHKYDTIYLPEEWYVSCFEGDDMDVMVNCPHCGKELRFGETYTSREIQTQNGFGYGVCEECYAYEWERQKDFNLSQVRKNLLENKDTLYYEARRLMQERAYGDSIEYDDAVNAAIELVENCLREMS